MIKKVDTPGDVVLRGTFTATIAGNSVGSLIGGLSISLVCVGTEREGHCSETKLLFQQIESRLLVHIFVLNEKFGRSNWYGLVDRARE